MKKLTSLFLLCILFSTAAYAKSEGNLSEAYGMVKKIENNQMTVTVIDPKTTQTSDTVFSLTPETQLVIVRPASEVIEGDEVKINYADENKEKVAQFVSILDLPVQENPNDS